MVEAVTDREAIIRLEAKVEALTVTIAANNIASVERDTRIESAVNAINGTVRGHEAELRMIERARVEDEARGPQHDEMWTAYRVGRWVGITVTAAMLVQSVGIVILLLESIG